MDKISVIIPVYKVENYLERCVRSVCNQTYPELEILLIDDGSPDRSGEICDVLAGQDARIRVIHKSNGGLSDARGLAGLCGQRRLAGSPDAGNPEDSGGEVRC